MAPTEGRVAKPEWWWGCHRGTPEWPLSQVLCIGLEGESLVLTVCLQYHSASQATTCKWIQCCPVTMTADSCLTLTAH